MSLSFNTALQNLLCGIPTNLPEAFKNFKIDGIVLRGLLSVRRKLVFNKKDVGLLVKTYGLRLRIATALRLLPATD